jgi:HK97 family phage prohead protease
MGNVQIRDSGAGDGSYTISALPIVFNSWSLPLGFSGFYERIMPGATKVALENEPHVLHLWDHDSRFVLGSTANGTLDLTESPEGVRSWTRVAPTTFAADLRVLLERGDIDQGSFAFTIERESWTYLNEGTPEERIEVSVEEIGELFDVTTCAMGAYPDTSTIVQNSLHSSRDRLHNALQEGRVEGLTLDGALERGLVPDLSGSGNEDPERKHGVSVNDIRVAEGLAPLGEDGAVIERSDVAAEREKFLAQARASTKYARATLR